MMFRIAQIGMTVQKGRAAKQTKNNNEHIDRFIYDKAKINAKKLIFDIAALPEMHEKHPYDAVCIEMPFIPETRECNLGSEQTTLFYEAMQFAGVNQLPVYFKLPENSSPVHLSRELNNYATAYGIISNSFFWKATKPFRLLMDGIKFVFRHIPGIRRIPGVKKVGKGLRYLKKYGFRATVIKMRTRSYETKFALKKLYTKQELNEQRKFQFARNVKFSILVPLYNTPVNFLKEMIASVTAQTYANWELCLADGSDAEHANVGQEVEKLAAKDGRIVYCKLEKNLGISENTNACIDMATGDYIALFDHDDILHPAALFNMMEAICNRGADFIYTDEATFASPKVKKILTAHYKPDFAPDNLRANNYICHFSAFSKEVLLAAGKFRKQYDGSQDHDMILRLTAHAKTIVHIQKVLYYWRSHPQSVAQDINSKPYAILAGRNAVKTSVTESGYEAKVSSSRAFPTIFRIEYEIKRQDLVSIIIPNKNHIDDLKKCINSILALSTYPNYEIIIVDNGSTDSRVLSYYNELNKDPKIKVCTLDIPFHYSKLNNYAASKAKGKYLLFLNNDIEIITPAWIEEMLMYVQRDDVGAAGAMLYYPNDTIQHAGIVIGMGDDGVAGHLFYKQPRNAIGYMGRLCYSSNVSAVTAACMMVKADLFHQVGGWDENYQLSYYDVDLCMKIRKENYLIVWTPYAEAYHYETNTLTTDDSNMRKRKRFEAEKARFLKTWAEELRAGDPYFNPNFSLLHSSFTIRN